MEKLPTAGRTYYSAYSVPETHLDNMRPPEYLNKHNLSGLSPHKLHLKIGAPVMLLRNMDRCEQSSSFLPLSCLSFEPVLLTAIQKTRLELKLAYCSHKERPGRSLLRGIQTLYNCITCSHGLTHWQFPYYKYASLNPGHLLSLRAAETTNNIWISKEHVTGLLEWPMDAVSGCP